MKRKSELKKIKNKILKLLEQRKKRIVKFILCEILVGFLLVAGAVYSFVGSKDLMLVKLIVLLFMIQTSINFIIMSKKQDKYDAQTNRLIAMLAGEYARVLTMKENTQQIAVVETTGTLSDYKRMYIVLDLRIFSRNPSDEIQDMLRLKLNELREEMNKITKTDMRIFSRYMFRGEVFGTNTIDLSNN